ncbi:MAG: hypothetical protein ACKVVP_13170, partial [Chloroflexota bacterium]
RRRELGLPPFAWTDDPVIARFTLIRVVHFLELRQVIQELWRTAGRGLLPGWTAGSPPSPERVIFAADVNDLRLWTAARR